MRRQILCSALALLAGCGEEPIDCTNKRAHAILYDKIRRDFDFIARHPRFAGGEYGNLILHRMVSAYDEVIADPKENPLTAKAVDDWMAMKKSLKFAVRTVESSRCDNTIQSCSCQVTVSVDSSPDVGTDGRFVIDYTVKRDLAIENGLVVEPNLLSATAP